MAGQAGRPRTALGHAGDPTVTPERKVEGKWMKSTAQQAQRWRARVRVRDAHDGVVRQVVKFGKTKGDALRALREALATREQTSAGTVGYRAGMLVTDAAEMWLEGAKPGLSQRSVEQYTGTIKRHIQGSNIAALTLREVNRVSVIKKWLQGVADGAGEGAAKTARTVLRGILDAAVLDEALTVSAAAGRTIKPPKPSKAKETVRDTSRALTRDERQRLVEVADKGTARAVELDVADVIAFMAGTGVRIGEALAVRWDDVHLDSATVDVHGTKTESAERVVEVPAWLLDRLVKRAKTANLEGMLFPTPGGKRGQGARFKVDATKPRDGRNVARVMREVFDAAGLEWATPHSLRRTVATLAAESGVAVHVIARHLGHSNPAMTASVYLDRHAAATGVAANL